MQWEYRLIEIDQDYESDTHPTLTQLGDEGWEAVSMFGRIESTKDDPVPMTAANYSERTKLVILMKRPFNERS